ncbi:hypothetical protein [Microbaculum marinum]|uniref:Secreted protein n=2 Tax=Microbaculum marinum TaxID=1764581 RepID=A0AAW9RKH4_9HYPH
MLRLVQLSFVLLFGSVGISLAQPIYLGEQEFDTGDRDAMAALIERCTELAEEDLAGSSAPPTSPPMRMSGEAEAGEAPPETRQPAEAPTDDVAVADREMLSIDIEGLASGDGKQEAAGEGAGPGAPHAEGSDSETQPDLADVTVQACREAGVVY